jgi:hypothetical protein
LLLELNSGSFVLPPGSTAVVSGRITNTIGAGLNASDLFLNFSEFQPTAFSDITQTLGDPDFTLPNNTRSSVVTLFTITTSPDVLPGVYPVTLTLQDVNNNIGSTVTISITVP